MSSRGPSWPLWIVYLYAGPVQGSLVLPWHHLDPEPTQSCPALTQGLMRFKILCFFADQVKGVML